ncbi:MAG: sigma-70 family RNA polymerase sigma factor [Actinobacteria bacterium]|nr:sigma-70 family RNA polymerase sigma factor [Actinomycetota bacterium]
MTKKKLKGPAAPADGPEVASRGASGGTPTFGAAFPAVLDAARADAPWAYQRLFDWLSPAVVGYLRGRRAEDPDGLANEVFLRVFRNLPRFEGNEGAFRSWVFTIAHHVLADDCRRRRRRPALAEGELPDIAGPSSTEADALAHIGLSRVSLLLDELSPDQRDVLLLRVVADLTVDQVAHTLGKTTGSVKQLQRRALATLRRRLRTADPEHVGDPVDVSAVLAAP